jgi:hypothetical protein
MRDFAKVREAIIGTHPIDMVDLQDRPTAGLNDPRDTMGQEVNTIDAPAKIPRRDRAIKRGLSSHL